MATAPPREVVPTPYFLEGVDRVMKVLDCFTRQTPELRLTDLSDRLGMSKAQVLRIVSTLESGGYLTRDPETKRYRLGLRLFHLGMVVRQQMDLRTFALPHLRRLAELTTETAALFVPEPLGPICVEVVQSPRATGVFAQLGSRMPWHAGTSAKVILAFLPDGERERILAQAEFTRYTDSTVTDPSRLRQILARIRDEGYHVAVRDLDEDAIGVGAPIFDAAGRITGAIGVAAPVGRLADGELARILRPVREATADISRLLGYPSPPASAAADD